MCVTGNKYIDLALGVAVVAVTAGAAAPAVVPAIGITAFNIGVGAALGATAAGALGNDPLQGALFGAVTGGVMGPAAAAGPAGLASNAFTSVLVAGAGAGALDAIMPKAPDYTGFTQASQVAAEQQRYNSQQIATTGSGGRQASASLAQAISRSKKRKLSQADVSDLSIDTSSFASTGLQFA